MLSNREVILLILVLGLFYLMQHATIGISALIEEFLIGKYNYWEPKIISYFYKESHGPNYKYFLFLVTFWLWLALKKLWRFSVYIYFDLALSYKKGEFAILWDIIQQNILISYILAYFLMLIIVIFMLLLYYLGRILLIIYRPKKFMTS